MKRFSITLIFIALFNINNVSSIRWEDDNLSRPCRYSKWEDRFPQFTRKSKRSGWDWNQQKPETEDKKEQNKKSSNDNYYGYDDLITSPDQPSFDWQFSGSVDVPDLPMYKPRRRSRCTKHPMKKQYPFSLNPKISDMVGFPLTDHNVLMIAESTMASFKYSKKTKRVFISEYANSKDSEWRFEKVSVSEKVQYRIKHVFTGRYLVVAPNGQS